MKERHNYVFSIRKSETVIIPVWEESEEKAKEILKNLDVDVLEDNIDIECGSVDIEYSFDSIELIDVD